MPARIVVELAPVGAWMPVPPAHTGPGVYFAVLKALRDGLGDSDLSGKVHDARPKPISVTPLFGEDDRLATAQSRTVRFEIGVLVDRLVEPALDALKATSTIRIAQCQYRIAGLSLAAALPYGELASSAVDSASGWALRILTPVAFETTREEGARRLRTLPEPEWVFGALLSRWHAFAPYVALSDHIGEAISGHLAVSDWTLSKADHLVLTADPARGRKDLVWRGSVGEVTYRIVEAQTLAGPVRASLDALVALAAYGGIGDRTNVGMGCVRLHREPVGRADEPGPP